MKKQWNIQLFAGLAERIGTQSLTIENEASSLTASRLKALLIHIYPEHEELLRVSFAACNQQYAPDDAILNHTDEIALLPPVSGGEDTEIMAGSTAMPDERFSLTELPLNAEQTASYVMSPNHGASLVFIGTTREWTGEQQTVHLSYEAYAPMALKTMRQIGEEINARWPGTLTAIAHRLGIVEIGEASVVIAVSSPHRNACYEASRYAIDRLKQIVPIWKKEIWEDGSEWKGHQQGPWDPTAPST
ncbi:molybdopterin converting factor [Paenibacillus sambharensis]|uniref:Molybdopterin synthase catalytic subunit n=1 Tax=Paenibacillus sambharensis TaxID=1803190 RepID=A0A2W1L2Q3_9BACL|nr:molybdenum cofactor biosynthesis protein MoaE [Paenibacillus sambharensis]PZD94268.1 molybdopterin converting factor [Paenibacillus sambharensis]